MVGYSAANPEGGVVVGGGATLSESGKVMTIDQTSDRAIIQWDRFENTASETIRFQQPSSSATALNRVVGSDPSLISGTLEANGRVFLINPSGVVFGPTARVDVGGIAATTLDIPDDRFLAGDSTFVQTSGLERSAVVNRGRITTPPGGRVALIAPLVSNEGVIEAPGGDVILQSGALGVFDTPPAVGTAEQVYSYPVRMPEVGFSPELEQVVNTSSIAPPADRVERLDDGTVFLRGAGGIVYNGGTVDVEGTGDVPSGTLMASAQANLALGPRSRLSAAPTAGAPDSGVVQADAALNVTVVGPPGDGVAEIAGSEVSIIAGTGGIRGSDAGSIHVKGGKQSFRAFEQIGSEDRPLQLEGGQLFALAESGSLQVTSTGDLVVDFVFGGGGSRLHSDGSLLAGRGRGNDNGFVRANPIVVFVPVGEDFLPLLLDTIQVISGDIEISAGGDIGNIYAPLVYFGSLRSSSAGEGRESHLVMGDSTSVILPGQAVLPPVVQATPVPRTRYVPPTDPEDTGVIPSTGGVLGARDNVLLSTLRNGSRRSSSADYPDRDGAPRKTRATRLPEDRSREELEEATGGLIRFVDRSRARRSDPEDIGSGTPAADGDQASARSRGGRSRSGRRRTTEP